LDSQISDRLKIRRVPILNKQFGYLELSLHDSENDWYLDIEVEQKDEQSPAIISAQVGGRVRGCKVSFPVAPTLVLTADERTRIKNYFRALYERRRVVFGYRLDPTTYVSERGSKIYFCGDKSMEDFAERAERALLSESQDASLHPLKRGMPLFVSDRFDFQISNGTLQADLEDPRSGWRAQVWAQPAADGETVHIQALLENPHGGSEAKRQSHFVPLPIIMTPEEIDDLKRRYLAFWKSSGRTTEPQFKVSY
jgi:hypothetical protein